MFLLSLQKKSKVVLKSLSVFITVLPTTLKNRERDLFVESIRRLKEGVLGAVSPLLSVTLILVETDNARERF